MAKHLLIILIALTHNCYAQKTVSFEEADSLSKAGVFINVKLDSNGRIIYQLPIVDTIYTVKGIVEERFDTVLVVLQMSNTSEYNVDDLGKVYWDFGYEVRETFSSFTSYKGVSVHDYDHISYLDIDRNPLPQNILVWQSKQY